jgi:hypothetical protein
MADIRPMTFITPALAPRLARLGPVMQLAFVPQEPERALDFWTRTMGVGPFFRFDGLVLNDALYKKLPTDIRFSFLVGYWNDMQIEIIIQHNDAPSI